MWVCVWVRGVGIRRKDSSPSSLYGCVPSILYLGSFLYPLMTGTYHSGPINQMYFIPVST